MLFSALVLIAVYREHDRLQELVDLRHRDKPTKVCNVSWLALEQEKQIAVLLRLLVVRKRAFGEVCRIIQVARHLVTLSLG